MYLRDRSCLLRCSLRLKARLQNWHLYFFSGALPVLRAAGEAVVAGIVAVAAAGIRRERGCCEGPRTECRSAGVVSRDLVGGLLGAAVVDLSHWELSALTGGGRGTKDGSVGWEGEGVGFERLRKWEVGVGGSR
jgi:hypothetical protein